jgi:hypothetical protein
MRMSAFHVRRNKAALIQQVQAPPDDRSSRKQPGQAWRHSGKPWLSRPVSPTVAPYSPSARPHVLAIVVSLGRGSRSSVGATFDQQGPDALPAACHTRRVTAPAITVSSPTVIVPTSSRAAASCSRLPLPHRPIVAMSLGASRVPRPIVCPCCGGRMELIAPLSNPKTPLREDSQSSLSVVGSGNSDFGITQGNRSRWPSCQ